MTGKKEELVWSDIIDDPPLQIHFMLYILDSLGLIRPKSRHQRKLRLFACACCRRVWQWLKHDCSLTAIEVTEEFADGSVTARTRLEAWRRAAAVVQDEAAALPYGADGAASAVAITAAPIARRGTMSPSPAIEYALSVSQAASNCCAGYAAARVYEHNKFRADLQEAARRASREYFNRESGEQIGILQDMFGNPFRAITVDANWRTPQIVALAQAAYDDRDIPSGHLRPTSLGTLADALTQRGCASESILGHLQSPAPHVRGCWVIDLLRGKA
jgi:hypothetical protein